MREVHGCGVRGPARPAAALLAGLLALCWCAGAVGADPGPEVQPAEIELRKSFRFVRRPSRHPSPGSENGAAGDVAAGPAAARRGGDPLVGAAAGALGEPLQATGSLHLPGVGERGVVLEGAKTPVLETATGRRLIIDRERSIEPGVAAEIPRLWPGYAVVQPAAGADLRDLIGSLLDAAGYDTVLRSKPLLFGSGATIRYEPDFVVLRAAADLLEGETRTISVLDPVDALPDELRELAAGSRVRIVELSRAGTPLGADQAPWRDPAGRVTTVETGRAVRVLEEIAAAAGLQVERRVPLPAAPGDTAVSADLRVSRGDVSVLVFGPGAPPELAARDRGGDGAITVRSAAELSAAIGTLLGRFGMAGVGPTVEFYRTPRAGSSRRFVISVPGWLFASGGRRLLVTGAAPPALVRLYLTREGIDILEYRIREGR